MAQILGNGLVQFNDGQILYSDTPISGQHFMELQELLPQINPTIGRSAMVGFPFVSGGGGGAGTPGARGADGAPGSPGPQGVTGVAGGGTGPQGATGPQGVTGPTTGVQGSTGVQGPQGQTGIQGQTGAGTPGATGVQGPQGQTGVQGATGAGVAGATGVQGPTGVQGTQGATGAGVPGATGVQGPTGAGGTQGATGVQGGTGVQGVQGQTGVGAQGTTGAQGATGASSITAAVFSFSHISGSASTGALGFTPKAAWYTGSVNNGTGADECHANGFAIGTGTNQRSAGFSNNVANSPQSNGVTATTDGQAIFGQNTSIQNTATQSAAWARELQVTAFGAGGITLTWSSAVNAHSGNLLVIG